MGKLYFETIIFEDLLLPRKREKAHSAICQE
jgi:hypothetical protein